MDNSIQPKKIMLPLTRQSAAKLRAGELVLITGRLLTARDAAHRRLAEAIAGGQSLPVELGGGTVYYTGPCPPRPGQAAGSCGPTTSGRMDAYTLPLLEQGLLGMIGKGARSKEVESAMAKFGAVYFAAVGGAGALYADCVKRCEVAAYPELLSEAIYIMDVEDFPAVVATDSTGASIYSRAE